MVQDVAQPNLMTESPAGIWSRTHRSLTIGLILTVSGAAFEALAVATTLPATIRDLGGLALYGWAFSAFMLANLIGITVAGAEADRQGPARPFIAGIAAFVLGLIVVGLAPSMLVVILGRAVQGFGAGVISSVAYIGIGRGYPESAKPRMLAVLSSAWVVPGLIGPALAGVISDYAGWRWVFLGLVPIQVLGAILTLPALRRLSGGHAAARNWSSYIDALRLSAGAGLALAGLGQLAQPLLALALIIGGAAVGFPSLLRLLPAGTLRAAHGLPAAIAAHGLLNLAFFGVDAFVPLALTSVRGQTATLAGLALTTATVGWTTGAWVQAHLAGSRGRRGLEISGVALIALGTVGVAVVLAPGVPVLLAPLAWGIAGLGMGFAFSTNSLVVLEAAPPGQEGVASAALQLANTLGVAIGAGIGGAIIGSDGTTVSAWSIVIQNSAMIGVLVLTALAASRLPSRPAVRG
ncbi:MAG TPA: MFS transporter [Roseiflexaceae bacterium]|nr:MFS transporter [Roseiflexaceae bacterium]